MKKHIIWRWIIFGNVLIWSIFIITIANAQTTTMTATVKVQNRITFPDKDLECQRGLSCTVFVRGDEVIINY